MLKVKFTRPYVVQSAEGRTYEKGSIHDFKDGVASHFIRRGAAVEVSDDPEPVEAVPDDGKSDVAPNDVKQPQKTTGKETGQRGGDPVKRAKKAQRAYRKKVLSGETDD